MTGLQSFLRIVTAIAIITMTSGCAVIMNMPSLHYDSPETRGPIGTKNGGGFFGLGAGGNGDLTLVSDTTATPPVETREFKTSGTLNFLAGLGLLDNLDLELRFGMTTNAGTPTMLRAKYQFMGKPLTEAKAGNFALAAILGGGLANQTTTDSNTFSTPNVSTKNEATFSEYELAMVAGYRFTDILMIYGEPYVDFYRFSVTVTRTEGTPISPLSFSGTARQVGFNLGFQVGGNSFTTKLEAGYAYSTSLSEKNSGLSLGVMLGFPI